ncbi:MAG: O-methyltransferase [Lachnospiraceae bacterium]|nr:O-methyltransferase [Lachnospiraceae bacterium]
MIVNEHITKYLESLDGDEPSQLMQLERWALSEGVPIIRRDTQRYLRFMLTSKKPKAVLEIGTAVGFSTLYMLEYAPEDCMITTLEKVEMRLAHARKNLAGHERINLIEGEAGESLKQLVSEGRSFDMIFLDAAKGQYPAWLPDILKLLPAGGVLLTDNVLLEGSIAESKFSIERRDRTIHMRMRDYLYEITHNERLETVILPIGDGLAVSYVKG